MKSNKKPTLIYGYYAALLLILLSWTNVHTAPGEAIRILFLAAVVAPAFVDKLYWMPAAIICFFTISQYGYAYSYMPTTLSYYVYILIIGLLITTSKRRAMKPLKLPIPIICFGLLLFVIDYLYSGTITYALFSLIIITLLSTFVKVDDIDTIKIIELSFVVVSITLSIMYMVMRKQFLIDALLSQGYERGSWTDLNYFGMIAGFGSVISLMNLFSKSYAFKLEKLLYIANLVVIFPALVLIASRGAILSVILSFGLIIFVSDASKKVKIGFIILACLMVAFLYTNNYFTLLQHRIQADDGTGSGRTTIWFTKLNAFFERGSVLKYLLGYGRDGGLALGTVRSFGFHNDFIAILVEYGFLGLSLFIATFISIIRKTAANVKPKVLIVSVYVFLCCLTLEPFTLGVLPFWLILLYLAALSKCKSMNAYE